MNRIIKIFNYQFYVKEILLVLFGYLLMDQIFSWLLVPSSSFIRSYEKIGSFAIYLFILYSVPQLKRTEQVVVALFSLLMVRLVLQSLHEYDSWFQQLSMFYVLFPVIYILFIKYICSKFDLDLLEFLAKFYLLTYIIFMPVYGRDFSFSLQGLDMKDLGVFSGDGRIIHATAVFMMIIPLLWFLDKYIQTMKLKFLLPFFFCATVILIHQHRSVWSCAIFSILLYLFMIARNNRKKIPTIAGTMVGFAILLLVVYFFIDTLFPDLVEFLGSRFSDILDPSKKDSTGSFRADQREVYSKLFLQKPIFGWSFQGFEMPNPLVDWWDEKTGQHFHEGFMEVLFYLGITGFLLKYGYLFYLGIKVFDRRLDNQTILLIAFSVSGLLFSLNYVPRLIFWGHVGLALYYLEKDQLAWKEAKLAIQEKAIMHFESERVSKTVQHEH